MGRVLPRLQDGRAHRHRLQRGQHGALPYALQRPLEGQEGGVDAQLRLEAASKYVSSILSKS